MDPEKDVDESAVQDTEAADNDETEQDGDDEDDSDTDTEESSDSKVGEVIGRNSYQSLILPGKSGSLVMDLPKNAIGENL